MPERRSPGPKGPDPEPREFETHDAARDQAPEMRRVSRDHTVSTSHPPFEVTNPQSTPAERVHDSGWYEDLGSRVRVVVLGGPPSAHRSAWFRGIIVGK